MDKKAHDIEREIERLRVDTDLVLDELERRLRQTMDLRAQAEHHPLFTTIITLSIIASLGLLAYNTVLRPRMRQRTRFVEQQKSPNIAQRVTTNAMRKLVKGILEQVKKG